MSKLKDINSTDILEAIRLGCQTMCNVFNADDNHIPFFGSRVLPEAMLNFSSAFSEAHIPGRHLNALLNAEKKAGIELDEECIKKHARAAFFSYSGPIPLPLNRERIGGTLINFRPHSIREGFHALYALATYRYSERALKLAKSSIMTILEYWHPVRGWDLDYLTGKLGLNFQGNTFIQGLARSIGPLAKFYRTTGSEIALDLALLLKEKALDFFKEEGSYDQVAFGCHTHSTTCAMSSLAQLADLTSDRHLMNRVQAFYNQGLWEIRDEIGWVIENSHHDANPDRGEINNTGDILETALILGRNGYPEYYQDAECIIRSHLLPSQLRDISFIKDPPNPDEEDGKRNVAKRHLGAFGFPAPYGHQPIDIKQVSFNMDIVGGAVGSLCEVIQEIIRSDRSGHRVNLLFDHNTPELKIESPYTHPALRIWVKHPAPLFVRIPSWVNIDQIKVEGTTDPPQVSDNFLCIPQPPINRPLTFVFDLPEREISLSHRTRRIRARLQGDRIFSMENFGAKLTFFDPLN